jgi:hypothetical protein
LRVLFLDIDGVLNCAGQRSDLAESSSLDAGAVARLNDVIARTGAKLVLSSSWRYLILGGAMTVSGFEYLLRTHGVAKGCLAGHTCGDEDTPERGAQIHRWLAEHETVTGWAAVDDGRLQLGADGWRQVQTDQRLGLTDGDAEALVRILTGTS